MADRKDPIRSLIETGRRSGKLTNTEIGDAMEKSGNVLDVEQMEKLYEELLLSGEGMQKTKNDLLYIGHEIAFDPAAFEENLMLLRAIPETDEPALRAKLREMVPTFHAPDGQTLPGSGGRGITTREMHHQEI